MKGYFIIKLNLIMKKKTIRNALLLFIIISLVSCATTNGVYHDPNMDFGAVQNVAVMPFLNLSRDQQASDRVRDAFINSLLATGSIYVIPTGEVYKGIAQAGIANPVSPSKDDVIKLGTLLKVDAVFTGVIREYGEVRSGTTSANVISISMQMLETQTGRVVWSASSTKGGIGITDRLLGGGGKPLNEVTVQAVNDIIDKLFR